MWYLLTMYISLNGRPDKIREMFNKNDSQLFDNPFHT